MVAIAKQILYVYRGAKLSSKVYHQHSGHTGFISSAWLSETVMSTQFLGHYIAGVEVTGHAEHRRFGVQVSDLLEVVTSEWIRAPSPQKEGRTVVYLSLQKANFTKSGKIPNPDLSDET